MMRQFEVPGYAAVSDTGFVFLGNTGETFNMNELAKEIYEQIKLHKNNDEIFSFVLENYEVDRQTFERDFEDYINRLLSFGLLKEI